MKKLYLFYIVMFLLGLLSRVVWGEAPSQKELESQLGIVQTRKMLAQSEMERGRLMIENGQMWLERFTAEEQSIQQQIQALKEPTKEAPHETKTPPDSAAGE